MPATAGARAAQLAAGGARLALVLLVVWALAIGDATSVTMGVAFSLFSLAVSRLAPPALDAGLALVLAAHGWATLLGQGDAGPWGPAVHLLAPFLLALSLAAAAAGGRLGRPAAPVATAAMAIAGGLAVIVGWEALEAALARLPGVEISGGRSDAVTDLALGAAAVLAGAALAALVPGLTRAPGGRRSSGPREG
jgi:hypothetical protein